MVPSFDTGQEDCDGAGWRLRKRVWCRLGDCITPPPPCVIFLSIKRCSHPLIGCVVETPPTLNSVIRTTYAIWTNTFIRRIWRTSKYQHIRSAHSPTLVSMATAPSLWTTLCVHESDLHGSLSPRTIFKTPRTVHQNLHGNKSDSSCLAALSSSCYT